MTHTIKLVLTDLDGTVVFPDSETAPPETTAIIREAEKLGVQFAAVTGRPHWLAKGLLKDIDFNDPCAFEGGALIMNPATEEILWSKTVPVKTTKKAVDILAPFASIMEYGLGDINAVDADSSLITEPALSIWASVPAHQAEKIIAALQKLPDVAVHGNAGPGGDYSRTGIQVTHFQADKEHAVVELLRLTGVDPEHTLAIGDGNNDLPLFRHAKLKIAMGNASDLLKTAADYTVARQEDGGFIEALRRFVIDSSPR